MNSTTTQPRFELHRIRITETGRLWRPLAVAGATALGGALTVSLLAEDGLSRWFHAYLLAVCFFLSISLGALFFVILQHLTGARWSVVTRRIAELLTTTIPLLGVMMLPILLPLLAGNSALYEWNDATLRASDPLIQAKGVYLNATFFAIRCVVYFAIWSLLSRFFLRNSLQQDETDGIKYAEKMRRYSGPAMIAFAITTNFAAFDWLMSLDPHWFSTIFGIYFFAGCVVAFFAALPILSVALQRQGYLANEITTEHYHDMAKLLFGFVMFWAYIAFSQYLLIWYANIPEETAWFLARQRAGWQFIGLLLVVGHFALPFFGLLSRSSRRNRRVLVCWSVFLLMMHWFDLFWLVMPNVSPAGVPLGLVELLCSLGVGAIWLAAELRQVQGIRLVPTGDPHVRESLAFHNV